MQLPQLNINGTDRDVLLDDYLRARKALNHAIEALCAAAPHGRDYQTLHAGSLSLALSEHADRMVALRKVLAEIETIAEHIV